MEQRKRKRKKSRKRRLKQKRIRAYLARTVFVLIILAFSAFLIFGLTKLFGLVRSLGDRRLSSGIGEEKLLVLHRNGSLSETSRENFDSAAYDSDGVEELARKEIDAYNAYTGKEDSVKLTGLSFKNGEALITMEYAGAMEYAEFNRKNFLFGDAREILEELYGTDVQFVSVKDSGVYTPEELNKVKGRAVVLDDTAIVSVPGRIRFASPNVDVVKAKQARVREGDRISVIIY